MRRVLIAGFLLLHSLAIGRTYICTAVYCDPVGQESIYPNTSNKQTASSSAAFQEVYWRCAAVMFASSIKLNPHATHILFTNKSQAPHPYNKLFNAFQVNILQRDFTYNPPLDYYPLYRNTFYLLDVIDYLAQRCKDDDTIIIIDSDVLWVQPASQLQQAIKEHGSLSYIIPYNPDHEVHKRTRNNLRSMCNELLTNKLTALPNCIGGELIAATGKWIKKIAQENKTAWSATLEWHHQGEPTFNTEEHLLSCVFHELGINNGIGNKFIKRLLTLGSVNNIREDEPNYALWHLPAEKKRGFVKLIKQICKPDSPFWQLKGQEYITYCADQMYVAPDPKKQLYPITKPRF